MLKTIKKGLDVPISGRPEQDISDAPAVATVALLGDDYVGMRPKLLVAEGDKVKIGTPVFEDKKTPGVIFTSPAAGTVKEINRGAKRRFLSLVIDVDGDAAESFDSFNDLGNLSRDQVQELLVKSGLWTALRTRPFSKVPEPGTEPHSLFVTAIDTNPLAAEPELIIESQKENFVSGLTVLSKLTEGKTYVCTREDSRVPGENVPNVSFAQFAGPHPAGLVGTHIHFLDPVNGKKTVWHINYQDVIAVGQLFTTGKLNPERVISLAGPRVEKPRLLRTQLGACLDPILEGNADLDNARVVSGSVLTGRSAEAPENFLGRYHNQVCVLEEGTKREFLGWQLPGPDKYSVTKIYAGSWLKKLFPMTTSSGGSKRAMVPMGTYEKVMPMDILPTQLLRSIIVGAQTGDTEEALQLGVLELDEEDLSLCTYVCPGKYDYSSILRENLTLIEKEG
ncbi:Na(+)-translocating NADH-quinone reductase subunit A [Mariniblastus fucicola]|uniref:Na(+)-translocating NADH-quinone reductase subunit A n=1 Tax=Mariniblastus fucicola TaxID=980251 RepID=A0A5B9PAX7_9BACT|nr:Na(+)-translocating NADH-quinone reductase subunit A [Mariniblastus fucicola]QEG22130.1 Na(+)-translocating NADH-quinone reductase subunit A [Mariniblastus fucicola]